MRNWEKRFPSFDVPRLVDYLVDKGHLVDDSQDDDDAPNFYLKPGQGEKSEASLFVNHPLRSMRDGVDDDRMRFVILTRDANGDFDKKFETDDLEEALIRVFETDTVAGWDILEPLVMEYRDTVDDVKLDPPQADRP